MRIGYFTNTYPRATDTFIQREVMGLRTRGIDVRTFSVRRTAGDHDVSPDIIDEKRNTSYLLPVNPLVLLASVAITFLRAPRAFIATASLAWKTARPGFRGRLWQLFYFLEAVLLTRELQRQGISHLHNHFGDASGTVAMLASGLSGVGYSITFHGPHIFFDPMHWALREKVRRARFIVCISNYCMSQMMLFSERSDWSRLKIVHCGVDVSQFSTATERPSGRLLYIGRLAAEKGLPVLFESLKLLRDAGYTFELTLVGDGPDRKALENLAQLMDLADRLHFVGYIGQDAVRERLQNSHVFILPSFAEGVPVSLMEAMACGVPVIGTYVGGVVELVEPGVTGQLVPPSDSVALRDAIARYLDQPNLCMQVSRQGRMKIEKDFNLELELDKLAALFRQFPAKDSV